MYIVYLFTEFFDLTRIFRVVPGFVVQFGIPALPNTQQYDKYTTPIKDDPILSTYSNVRGTITFANSGANTRTTQMFINVADNPKLDSMGFAPVGRVLGNGMDLIDAIYNKDGEKPSQTAGESSGNKYFIENFPKLSYFNTWRTISYRSYSNDNGGTCTLNALQPFRTTSPPNCDFIGSKSNHTKRIHPGTGNEEDAEELKQNTIVIVVIVLFVGAVCIGGCIWKKIITEGSGIGRRRGDRRQMKSKKKTKKGRRIIIEDDEEEEEEEEGVDAEEVELV